MTDVERVCDLIRAALPSYCDAETDRGRLDAHLAGCPECRDHFAALQADLRAMRCRDLVELASDYLEMALDDRESERLDRHLRLCQGCREYVQQLRRVIGLLARLGDGRGRPNPDSPVVAPSLLAAFRARDR
jgi:predicted anti-sigma-YlaC factor YlaD